MLTLPENGLINVPVFNYIKIINEKIQTHEIKNLENSRNKILLSKIQFILLK